MSYIAALIISMQQFLIQLPGYLAFIFLAVSLWVTTDIKFRWINSFGCLCFVLYGVIINAYPIVLTNSVLLAINIYFLFKIYNRKEKFDLVEFKKDAALIPKFLNFYATDINAYFPGFTMTDKADSIKFVVLRDIVVANIFVADVDTAGNAIVQINYTIPKYRDFKVGRFLFDEGKDFLKARGIKKIIYTSVYNPQHEKFIKVMGFKKEEFNNSSCYIKYL
ncbi:MAG: YgjV family protein [Ferruginibacter sp.]|nr:YgjV family protein [Ferruginibacter sp.]